MKRIGITGGIGSGKSTVCRLFETLGIPIYYADTWAKWLTTHDDDLRQGIVTLLGEAAYLPDGTYNRAYVAKIVFENPAKLQGLNALVHPAVERHSRAWHEAAATNGAPYSLKEAALMVESGSHRFLDALIVVTAPEDLRIQRVMERDHLTAPEVQARMKNQLPESEKLRYANYVIVNDGQQMIIPQVMKVHEAIVGNGEWRMRNES